MLLVPLLSWFTLVALCVVGGGRDPVCETHWVLLCWYILKKAWSKKGSTRVHPQWAPAEEEALLRQEVTYLGETRVLPCLKVGRACGQVPLRHTRPRRRPSSNLGTPLGIWYIIVLFCATLSRSSTASSSSCLGSGPPPGGLEGSKVCMHRPHRWTWRSLGRFCLPGWCPTPGTLSHQGGAHLGILCIFFCD